MKIIIIIICSILTKHSDTFVHSEEIIIINYQCVLLGSIDRCGVIHARNEKRASGRIDLAVRGRGEGRGERFRFGRTIPQLAFNCAKQLSSVPAISSSTQ